MILMGLKPYLDHWLYIFKSTQTIKHGMNHLPPVCSTDMRIYHTYTAKTCLAFGPWGNYGAASGWMSVVAEANRGLLIIFAFESVFDITIVHAYAILYMLYHILRPQKPGC